MIHRNSGNNIHRGDEMKPDTSVQCKNIYEYVVKNMGKCNGEFVISVKDMSEKESYMLLATIHPKCNDADTADFYLHQDGREEHTKL